MEMNQKNSVKQADFLTLSTSDIALIVANNELLLKQNIELKTQQAKLIQQLNWFQEQFNLLRHKKFAQSSEQLPIIQEQLFARKPLCYL